MMPDVKNHLRNFLKQDTISVHIPIRTNWSLRQEAFSLTDFLNKKIVGKNNKAKKIKRKTY